MSGLLLLVMIERVAVSSKTSSLASGGSPIHSCRALSQGLGGLLTYRMVESGTYFICHMPYFIWHMKYGIWHSRLLEGNGPDQLQSDDRAAIQSYLIAFGQKDSGDHRPAQRRRTSDGCAFGDVFTGRRDSRQYRNCRAGHTNFRALDGIINNLAAARASLERAFSVGFHFFIAREIGGRFHGDCDLLLFSFKANAVESDVQPPALHHAPGRLGQRDSPDHF